jgi:hypothetical protein
MNQESMSCPEEGGRRLLGRRPGVRRAARRRLGILVASAMASAFVAGATTVALSPAVSSTTISSRATATAPAAAVDTSAAAPLAMSGSASSNVVPQPDGEPSVFEEEGGALWNYWYSGGILNSAEIVNGGAVANPVAVTQSDGAPSVFFEGSGGSLWNYWYANGVWDAAEIATGGVASTPAVVLQANGAPTVFVRGPDNSLLNYWYIPSRGAWGAGTAAPPGSVFSSPAVLWQVYADDAPSVFVQGPGNSLLNFWYIPSQGTWGAGTAAPPGSVFSSPSVLPQVDAGDAPSVFVQGPGNSLLNFWYIAAQGAWGAGTVAPQGTTNSTPAVVAQVDAGDVPSVFVRTPGNAVLNFWYIPSAGSWGAGTVESNGTAFSGPGVVNEPNGAPTVFYQNAAGTPQNYSYVNGNWQVGPPPAAITVPSGTPYFTYSVTINEGGSGSGYSAYINGHDNNNDAVAVGIQSDVTDPYSNGQPYYIWELVQNGSFSYAYLGPAPAGNDPVTLSWWQGSNTAVFYEGTTPVADIPVSLTPRLFFSVEGDARQNGDSVNDVFTNTQITVGNDCPTYCGLFGTWNTSQFNYYGLQATRANSAAQNGADFTVTGTASGVPAGGNWGSYLIAGIAMIPQYWNGQ